jgi:hypothetical protein
MCLELFGSDNNLSVQRVLDASLNLYDYRQLHFIGDDDALSGLAAIAGYLSVCH